MGTSTLYLMESLTVDSSAVFITVLTQSPLHGLNHQAGEPVCVCQWNTTELLGPWDQMPVPLANGDSACQPSLPQCWC